MSDAGKAGWALVAYVVTIIISIFVQALFVKLGWNIGMDDVARHLGLEFQRISYATGLHITVMLWFLGGSLVGMNTLFLARRSDVR